jgi:Mn2+/Fe2+ NRAMP family transporter
VPYNLFLHASAVREKWSDPSMLAASRIDSLIAIGAGGLISMAIIITSAAAFYGTAIEINGASDLAVQLQPLLGKSSGIFLSVGLLSAGLSSAITAPLAAAYATAGVLGWDRNLRSGKFKFVWISVLLTGVILSTLGIKPVKAIFFAQITNAILLPLIAIFLLKVMNSKDRLGKYSNGKIANIAGFIVVSVSILLGFKTIFSLFKII